MNPVCLASTRKLVTDECCNYGAEMYGRSHHCFADKNHICRYFPPVMKRCRWFEEAVLPLEPALLASYHGELAINPNVGE